MAFRFAVTPYYLSLSEPDNPHCPILKQVLPSREEQTDALFTQPDPLAEESFMPVRGLTHRYPDRVLWYLSHNCAVYCRFCMRKRKVSQKDSAPNPAEVEAAMGYIEQTKAIKEVILSGGDPLSTSDAFLAKLLVRLRRIPHLVSIRLHTRMPVTLPQRFTARLLDTLAAAYPLTLVTHFNHASELSPEARQVVRELRMRGVLVLNQAVLLKSINDSVGLQTALHEELLRAGIKPYYLHQCDEVQGVSHFRVPIETGLAIMRQMRGRSPGIALPTYVVDLPGGGGKVPLQSEYLTEEIVAGRQVVYNYEGRAYSVVAEEPNQSRSNSSE